MISLKSLIPAAALFLGITGLASAASAQNCGVTGTNSVSIGNYDPFSPTGISSVTTSVSLTRVTGGGGKKTQTVNFYFVRPNGSPAYEILYNGSNVVFEAPTYAGAPTLDVNNNTPVPGLVVYDFGGAAQPDTITQSFTVTVPAGADLTAGQPISFDIRYVCKGTGGLSDVNTATILPNAFSLNLTVLSALQASYVGPALDFGEIGDLTTLDVLAAPATYTETGNVRVASSGLYTVALTSTNNFRLSDGVDTINYSMDFLGQTRTNASPTFTTRNCARAGLTGEYLPIDVTLLEGGDGKSPGSYSDTLNVTVTPVITAASPNDCDAY